MLRVDQYRNYRGRWRNKSINETFDTHKALDLAFAVYRKQGFIRSGESKRIAVGDDIKNPKIQDFWIDDKEIPTFVVRDNKTVIADNLKGVAGTTGKRGWEYSPTVRVSKKDKEYAEEAYTHYQALTFKKLSGKINDFEKSVLEKLETETTDKLGVAIIASLPKSYFNALKSEKLKDKTEDSEFIGNVKTREAFTLKVESIRYLPNYGIHLVTCTSNGKDIVKFFFNNDPTAAGIKDNKVIKIKGFIKSHVESDYNGLKETVINRVKMEN